MRIAGGNPSGAVPSMTSVTVLEPRARARRRRLVLPLAALLAAAWVGVALLAGGRDATAPRVEPPGLADLWGGRAALVLDRKWTSTSMGVPKGGAPSGSHVEIVGGTWYLFNRQTLDAGCAGHGPNARQMGT